jgi:hypothetical protein
LRSKKGESVSEVISIAIQNCEWTESEGEKRWCKSKNFVDVSPHINYGRLLGHDCDFWRPMVELVWTKWEKVGNRVNRRSQLNKFG